MEEFKLQFYFNLYKDKALPNREELRKNFKKIHGEFKYLEELILMIEKYQIKTYGCTLPNGSFVRQKSREELNKQRVISANRERRRLGK